MIVERFYVFQSSLTDHHRPIGVVLEQHVTKVLHKNERVVIGPEKPIKFVHVILVDVFKGFSHPLQIIWLVNDNEVLELII